mgnify:CR=1 FL=1
MSSRLNGTLVKLEYKSRNMTFLILYKIVANNHFLDLVLCIALSFPATAPNADDC